MSNEVKISVELSEYEFEIIQDLLYEMYDSEEFGELGNKYCKAILELASKFNLDHDVNIKLKYNEIKED